MPDGDIYANVNVTQYGIDNKSSIGIPYKIKNTGFFDLTDIQIPEPEGEEEDD